ncbi:MAG: cation transporter [Candidatus Marinimicrobia bacterium]|jgi:cation diffusion facilitator family transporter|nr:cation transporter [Candidatus Neomarinimicrobiota bacterium]MBT3936561.1 cation transporter [Candidatus Neomarinimicrobiota bacterium]MBT3961408.1 cation transporter [Candidatus Neomarinimicrobiota bacterium]MBT4382773.1 cation transporter [Candidatus Neomarinimicrobiota bacterium]MBT4635520.1 cation transporter [Candidatus Neomarinimicrobiota bacterium]
MFESITNIFVPKGKEPARIYRTRIGKFQGWVSVIINGILFIIKMGLSLVVGSISLLADAIHTLSDLISSAVVIWGFNEAEKPADEDHPYGHGRAEYIATLIIAILLAVAGIEFIESSISRLMNPEPIVSEWWMIGLIGLTILLKELTARYGEFLSQKIASGTLHADAWHHRTDAISSLLVLGAMIAGRYGYYQVDGWAGLGVALFIMWTGFEIAKSAIDDLLGKPPTEDEIKEVRHSVEHIKGVLGAHDIAIHSYGKDKYISIHIEIDGNESPASAHDISENVENTLKEKLGISPTVHVDPIYPNHPKVQEVRAYLDTHYSDHEWLSNFHDIRIVDTEEHHVILFGINFKPGTTQKLAIKCQQNIEIGILDFFPEFEVMIKSSGLHQF